MLNLQRITEPIADDAVRWAEALAIEQQHGMMAPMWIAERIGALAMAGDFAGVARFREIAAKYEQLHAGEGQA